MATKKTTDAAEKKAAKPAAKKPASKAAKPEAEVSAKKPAGSAKAPVTHEQIATLAVQYWNERGRPDGSPEVDWLRAVETLNAA